MKALVLKEKNSLPVYEEFLLEGSKEKLKIKILASAMNHRDYWIIKGQYAGLKYPVILGSDGVGLLDGKRVIINPASNWGDSEDFHSADFTILGLPEHGTFARYCFVDRSDIYDAPEHLDDIQAAALPLAGLTAFRALVTKCKPKKDELILVSGIGGGVALFALQFAVALGYKVIVTSGSDEKIEKAVSLGALKGYNYKDSDWAGKMIKEYKGVDVIIDGAAGHSFAEYTKIINKGGKIAIYGGTNGKISNLIPQSIFWKQISILGTTMGSPKDFQSMLDLVNTYKIVPVIDSTYTFEEFNTAFFIMENSSQFGKITFINS